MFTLGLSRLSLPLHSPNLFVSAFHAIIIIGMCDIRGTYVDSFEFHLLDLVTLYPSFVTWVKHFAQSSDILPDNDVIISRESYIYRWRKVMLGRKLYISLISENEGNVKLTINFNYENFIKLVQSIYFVTWEAMNLKEAQLRVMLPAG